MLKVFLVTVLTLLGTTSLWADTAAYDGLYKPRNAGSVWDCQPVGLDGGALSIENKIMHGVESRCELTNPVSVNGMSATLYDAKCTGEGETWNVRYLLMKADFGVYFISDQYVSEWESCTAH